MAEAAGGRGSGPSGHRVGVDVGGTFTDIVMVEEATGEILRVRPATVCASHVPAEPL